MGNQHSNTTSDNNNNNNRNNNPFGRVVGGGGGALGLSRAELDKRCQPSGLYDSCHWEERAIRKLVGDGKAAARLKGADYRTAGTADHECPICFLYYEEINVTKCCHANICTECFLQVRPQKEKLSACPFCNHQKLSVSVAKKLSEQEILEREMEEKRAEEARIRARNGSLGQNSGDGDPTGTQPIKIPDGSGTGDTTAASNKTCSFGCSLERDSRVAMMRKRSESIASSETSGHDGNSSSWNETSMIEAMAMTPEERRRLEAEMRNQNLHPLALQIEAEAEQRRSQNERNYYRSHSERRAYNPYGRSSRRRIRGGASSLAGGGAPRNWNEIVAAFERSGNGAVNSLDDLVVLEAAILLSMEEEARRGGGGGGGGGDADSDDNDVGVDFDAAQHARDGFPLVRSFLAGRGRDEEPATRQQVPNLARSLNSSRRRNQLMRSGLGIQSSRAMPDSALDTAALLMRGISEADQLAMAIAASLQDQNNSGNDNDNDNSNSNDETATEGISTQAEPGEETTETNDDTTAGESATVPEYKEDYQAASAPTATPAVVVDEEEDHAGAAASEDPEGDATGADATSAAINIELLVASASAPSGNAPNVGSAGSQMPNDVVLALGETLEDAAEGTDGAGNGTGDAGGGE